GHARSIGVSNFGVGQLEQVMGVANAPPVVDQVQFSPFVYRRALVEACEQHDVVLEAYSPLGTGRHLSNDTVKRIAEGGGRTTAFAYPGSANARNSPRVRTAAGSLPVRRQNRPTAPATTSVPGRSPRRTTPAVNSWSNGAERCGRNAMRRVSRLGSPRSASSG